MKKSERDRYWTELIQACRVSGLSDYEWCRWNRKGQALLTNCYNSKE